MQAPLAVVGVEEKGEVLKSGIGRVQKIMKLVIMIALLIWLSLLKIVTTQIRARKEGPLVVPKEECEAGRILSMVQQEVRWILTQNILQLQMRIHIHMQAITNRKELHQEG
jgi:hypothetical protein